MRLKYQLIIGFMFIMLLFGTVAYYVMTVSEDHMISYIETSEGFRKDVSAAMEASSYAKRTEGHLFLYWTFGQDIDREKFYIRHTSLNEQIAILERIVNSTEGSEKIEQLKSESRKILEFGDHVIQSYKEDPDRFSPKDHEDHLRGLHDASSQARKLGIEITELQSLVMKAKIEEMKNIIASLQRIMTIAIILAIIISIIFSLLFSHAVTSSLVSIRDTALDISKGNFDREADISSSGEIGELALAFNTMVNDLKRAQAEALRAGHLASLGELAAGVAHEINNPINGVINYAQLLADAVPPGSKEEDRANKIVKEGNRVAEIVHSLLSYAREEQDVRNPVSMSDLLSRTLLLTMQQSHSDAIRIETDVPENLAQVMVNPQQIQQVMLNVISNAKYALNQKYPGDHEQKLIDIRGEEVSENGRPFIRISFLDYGTGIPADKIQKATNPFFTTKPPGEGTGLGLSISNNIIRNHDGSLKIESVEGEFTRVTIDLPAIEKHG